MRHTGHDKLRQRERQPGRRTRSIILQRVQDVRWSIKSPKEKCCYPSSRDSWGKLETLAKMCMSLTGSQVTLTETLVLSLQEGGAPGKIGRLASLGRLTGGEQGGHRQRSGVEARCLGHLFGESFCDQLSAPGSEDRGSMLYAGLL